RDRETLRACEKTSARTFPVAPCVTSAGIEQDAHGNEIDSHACALERMRRHALRQLVPALDPACCQLPPAAVVWHLEVWIRRPRATRAICAARRTALSLPRKMRGAALSSPPAPHRTALAHGCGAAQLCALRRKAGLGGGAHAATCLLVIKTSGAYGPFRYL